MMNLIVVREAFERTMYAIEAFFPSLSVNTVICPKCNRFWAVIYLVSNVGNLFMMRGKHLLVMLTVSELKC